MSKKLINPDLKAYLMALDEVGGVADPKSFGDRFNAWPQTKYGVKNETRLWEWLADGGWIEFSPSEVRFTSKGKAAVRDLHEEKAESDRRKKAYDQISALVDRLKRKYPEAELSLGYLGNFEKWGDDRAWYVFSKLSRPGSYGHKSWKWGGYRADRGGIIKLWDWAKSNLQKEVAKAVVENDGPYKGPAPYRSMWASAGRVAEWKGWRPDMPVQVVTNRGTEVFESLAEAKRKYPTLNPTKNTRDFTWATRGRVNGRDAIRFEDWQTYKMMSFASARRIASRWLNDPEADPEHYFEDLYHEHDLLFDEMEQALQRAGFKPKANRDSRLFEDNIIGGYQLSSGFTFTTPAGPGEVGIVTHSKGDEDQVDHHYGVVNDGKRGKWFDWKKVEEEHEYKDGSQVVRGVMDSLAKALEIAGQPMRRANTGAVRKLATAALEYPEIRPTLMPLLREAKGDIPKKVEEYAKEVEKGNPDYDQGRVWATAWSIYCKYKNPGSPHCHQDSYFPGKKAGLMDQIARLACRNSVLRPKLAEILQEAASVDPSTMASVGDILSSSWGYNQTNIDFYEIVGFTKTMVKLRKIEKKRVGDRGTSLLVMPVPGRYKGPVLRRKAGTGWRGGLAVSINSYALATTWDGKPEEETHPAYGH